MAVSIDERVVEMRFNNKQFEEGVKKSMKSLNDLDQSIDKLDNNGLDNLVAKLNNVDFGQIERSLGSLEKRFSSFGVVGMTVIQDLVHGIESLAGGIAKAVSKPFDIMAQGGWQRAMNIEDAKFQLKGLGIAYERVQEDIEHAVNETAYGLDAAAKACAQLSASGVQAGDDMKKALRGISGVAAMANTSYENIAPIFTTVAGQGKLMTMQLRQLESRGLNAAAELGKSLGKSEQQVRQMVTDGKISFKQFAEAMDDAFGEHAKDANKTFQGSKDNMIAALKKIGAAVNTEVIQSMVDVHNALREAINVARDVLVPVIQNDINPAIRTVLKGFAIAVEMISKSKKFERFIKDIGAGLVDIVDALKSTAWDIFFNLGSIIDNLKAIGDAISVIYQNITGSDKKLRVSVIVIKALNWVLTSVFILLRALTFVIKNVMETLANAGLGGFIKTYLLPLAKIILPAIIAALILSKLHMLKIVGVIAAITTAVMVLIRLDILKYVLGIAKGIGVIAMALGAIVATLVGKVISIIETIRNFGLGTAIQKLKLEIELFFHTISTGAVGAAKGLVGGVLYILATPIRLIQSLINFILTTEGPLGRVRDFVITVFGVVKKNGGVVLGFVQGLLQGLSQTKPVFLLVGASMIAMLGIFTGLIKAINAFSTAFGNLTEAFKELAKIPSQITGTLQEMAKSAEIMAKAELRKQTIGLIIAFAGALVVLATAAALITKLIPYPEDFLMVAGGITAMGVALAIIIGVIGNIKAKADALKEATDQIQNVFQGITAVGKQFAKDIAKSIMVKAVGKFLISIAVLIGTITASLIALYKTIPDPGYINSVMFSLGIFIGAIAGVAVVLAAFASKSMSSGMAIGAFAVLFLAIASSFVVMAHAVELFMNMDIDMQKLVRILIAIGAASLTLIAVTALVAQAFKNVSMNILSLAVSVAALVLVLKTAPDFIRAFGLSLSAVINAFKEITQEQGMVIAVILAAIGATLVGMTAVSRMASHGLRMILVVTSVIGGLVAMLHVLKKLGEDETAIEHIVNAFSELYPVFLGLTVILGILFTAAGMAKYALRAMLLLGSLPLTLIALIGEFKLLEMVVREMDNSTIDKILKIMVGFGAILALILAFSGLAGDKAWATVMALTTTIVALTFCIGAMAMLFDAAPKETTLGVAAFIATLLSLTLLMKAIGDANTEGLLGDSNPIFKALIALGLVVTAIGGLAWAILNVTTDWKAIAAAFLGMDSVIIAMSHCAKTLGDVAEDMKEIAASSIVKAITLFAAAVGAIIAAAFAIKIAIGSGTDWASVAAAAIGMSAMIIAMAYALQIITKATASSTYSYKKVFQSVLAMVGIAATLVEVAFALQMLKDLPYQTILAGTVALGLIFLELSAAVAVLSTLTNSTNLIMVAVGLTMVGAAIAVMAAGLSVLAQCDENKITAAAWAIGGLFAVVAALIGVLSAIPSVAVAVIAVGASLSMTLLSVAASAAIITLSITVLTLALTYFLNFLIQNKDTISEALTNFGIGIYGFIVNVANAIKMAAISTAETVMEVANTLVDGLFRLLATAVTDLGKVLEAAAMAIGSFVDTVLDQIATGVSNGLVLIAAGIKNGLAGAIDILFNNGNIGTWMKISLIQGMTDTDGSVYKAGYELGTQAFNGAHDGSTVGSLSKAIMAIGGWIGKSLVVGMGKTEDSVYDAGYTVGDDAVEGLRDATGIHSFSEILGAIGEWFVDSFDTGILDVIGGGKLKGPAMLGEKAIDLIKGAIDGKSGGGGRDAGTSLGKSFMENGLTGVLEYVKGKGKEKAAQAGEIIGEAIGGETGKSIWNSISNALGLTDELITKQRLYNQALEETEKKYRSLDINNRLWQKQVKKEQKELSSTQHYNAKASETKTYQKEVDRLYKQYYKEQMKGKKGKWWKKLQKKLKETAEEIDLPTNFGDFGLGDLGSGSDKTATRLDNLAQSLSNATAGFKEFDRSINVTLKDMAKGITSQNKGIVEFQKGIEALAARGLDRKLIQEILDMGYEEGFEYVAELVNSADKKEIKRINKLYRKNGTLTKESKKWMKDVYTKDGKSVSKSWYKGAKDELKGQDIGKDIVTETGKKLKDRFKQVLNGLDVKSLTQNGKGALAKALNTYLDASTSKSKTATKAFQEYITKAYMATLSEEEMQEALSKSSEKLAKDVNKWWKEQEKAAKQSTIDQIRSMEDLTNAYKKTGKELITEYTKQGTDYLEMQTDRQYVAVAAKLAGASKEMIEYIENTMSIEDILGFVELSSEIGGEKAAKQFIKAFNVGTSSTTLEYDVTMSKGSKKELKSLFDELDKQKTKIKGYDELFEDAMNGITDGIDSLIASDKALVKMSGTISDAFVSVDPDTFNTGTAALQQYMLSLIDYETVLEEVKVTGVDVSEVVKTHLDTISQQVTKWKDSLQSSLKSALQSFDEFDTGEKKSLDSMVKNLQGNITKLNEWRANIKKMQELGYSQSLIDYMASQGINSYQEVAALTGDVAQYQIDEINQMWKQVADDSEKAATEALGAMALAYDTVGKDTTDGIVTSFVEEYKAKTESDLSPAVATSTGEAILEGLQGSADVVAKADKSELINKLIDQYLQIVNNKAIPTEVKDGILRQIFAIMNDPGVSDETKSAITKLYNDPSISAAIKTEIATKYGDAIASGTNKAVNGQKKKIKEKMTNLGKAGAKGLAKGLKDQESIDAITKATNKLIKFGVVQPAKDVLKIHSPSKVFEWIGEMTAEGFAIGFGNSAYLTDNEVSDFADMIMAYAQRLSDDLNTAIPAEDDFTIKPILDLDNLQNANSQIQSLLGNGDIAVRSNMLAGSISTNSDWSMLSKALSGMGGTSTTNTYGDIQITVNAPEGADANEIANAVMAKIQQSVDRRKYV